MKIPMMCSNMSIQDPNAAKPLLMVQFTVIGGIGSLHLYLPPDEAKVFALGTKFEGLGDIEALLKPADSVVQGQ